MQFKMFQILLNVRKTVFSAKIQTDDAYEICIVQDDTKLAWKQGINPYSIWITSAAYATR